MSPEELQECLIERAGWLEALVQKRIPSRFAGFINAEDILQDVWIAAFDGACHGRAGPLRNFDSWLVGVAKRQLATALRLASWTKRGGGVYHVRDFGTSSCTALFERMASSERTPSRKVSVEEAKQAVRIALASLPEDHRRAVQMRLLEDRSLDEIASEMNKSKQAVNSLIHRGKQGLRKALGQANRYLTAASSASGRLA